MQTRFLDRLIAFWILPPFGFLITVLRVPELRYVIANYVLIAVLGVAIMVRLWVRPASRRTLGMIMAGFALIGMLACIEWVHFLAGRKTIDGLMDIRMIVYSPLYGSLAIFALYAAYLTLLSQAEKSSHLIFVVKAVSWFHMFFIGYWLFLYLGWVDAIPHADLMHSNSISYLALFVLLVLYFFRDELKLGQVTYIGFVGANLTVMLLNQTRGAILGMALVAVFELLQSAFRTRRVLLYVVLLGSLGGMVAIAYTVRADHAHGKVGGVLGRDAGSLDIVLNEISHAYQRGKSVIVLDPSIVSDESSISAFSRIGSNYYSMLSFLDNSLIGIGQAESYAIDVLGSGVHSLHFLLANATGALGLLLLFGVILSLLVAQQRLVLSRRFVVMFLLFFGYVLVFTNSMPIYFALIVAVLGSRGRNRAASQPKGRMAPA